MVYFSDMMLFTHPGADRALVTNGIPPSGEVSLK
jgi:hypothetical protein